MTGQEIWLNRTVKQIPSSAGVILQPADLAADSLTCTAILLCNTSASTVTVDIYLVPNSSGSVGTATTADKIIDTLSIEAHDTVIWNDSPLPLIEKGDSIQAGASANNVVNIKLFGLAY